mgnify:FL=1
MQRKVFLQFFLFIIIIGMAAIFYQVYFLDRKSNITIKNIDDKKISENMGDSNIIYNVEYIAEDKKGSKYLINSEYGELNNSGSNIITLQEVTAIITFTDSSPINIVSDSAIYNSENYNTNFYGNVIVTYIEHNITSDKLDLNFEKNLANALNNVIYKNLNTTLEADKIEFNLLTKNSNVYMNNRFEKIKITNKK